MCDEGSSCWLTSLISLDVFCYFDNVVGDVCGFSKGGCVDDVVCLMFNVDFVQGLCYV